VGREQNFALVLGRKCTSKEQIMKLIVMDENNTFNEFAEFKSGSIDVIYTAVPFV